MTTTEPRPTALRCLAGEDRTDPELVAAYRDGDRDAVGELFARHRSRVRMVATANGAPDVDEVEGDVALALVRYASRWTGDAAFTTWLDRVTRNAAYTQRRRGERCSSYEPDRFVDSRLQHTGPAGWHPLLEIESGYAHVDDVLTLDSLMDALPSDRREALSAVDLTDRTVDEVAGVLGLPAGTLKSRRGRGLSTLRLRADEARRAEAAAS